MGDTGLHVRGRADPAQVRDGAQRSGLAQYSTGLAPLTPLCQGMSWAGTSVVRSCWDPTGLGYAGWEGCEEGRQELKGVVCFVFSDEDILTLTLVMAARVWKSPKATELHT